MKHAFCLAAVFASVFGSTILHAQSVIPQVMSFQGYVTQSDTAYTDTVGNTNVDLVLYDDSANGNQVWSHLGQKVKVFHGYYTVPLDFSTGWAAGVVHWSKQYWLDAFILNQELSPRVQLTSSAYSFVADTALHVASSVPIGTIEAYGLDLVGQDDSDWLPCDGSLVKSSDYPSYAIRGGAIYGTKGDSVYLPDLRGTFLRGVNAGRDTVNGDPDAAKRQPSVGGSINVGSAQSDAFEYHVHNMNSSLPTASNTAISNYPSTKGVKFVTTSPDGINTYDAGTSAYAGASSETRPRNVAVYWIIKVK